MVRYLNTYMQREGKKKKSRYGKNLAISKNFYVISESEVELRTSRIWDEFQMKIDHNSSGLLEERVRVRAYDIELDGEIVFFLCS